MLLLSGFVVYKRYNITIPLKKTYSSFRTYRGEKQKITNVIKKNKCFVFNRDEKLGNYSVFFRRIKMFFQKIYNVS